ncbi:hypothetical protein KVV02_003992 [Mortierella alpina]|uniref:Uncharacterized protein n=1 Tax=Mortierella alpina TaxID=64518 RepID=A0A9P8CZ39_MORAP|nr:hypothetical protein KVV02_003992 [Mortierella alpina]
MTHQSDLSYIQRSVSTSWFYGWFLVYVFRWDRFEALRLRRLMRFELRSVVTLLVLISLALQLAYDIGSARLKYLEGFWVNPRTNEIQSKPAQQWNEKDTLHVEPLYYTLACCLAFENCVFFLLQAFWSYISKSVTKSSFMSSFEFKVNITASCFVLVLFPTAQFLFRNDFLYREVVPQIIFSALMFITGVLGLRTHFRLVALIKNARAIMNETTINVVHKLEYFRDMNTILTFSFFACALSLGITAADGLMPHPVIAGNKLASDVLITNLNFFSFIIWVTLTLIFYPRKTGISSPFGSSNQSLPQKAGTREAHLPRFNDIRPHDEAPYRKVTDREDSPGHELYVIDSDTTMTPHTPRYNHHRSLSSQSRHDTSPAAPTPSPAAVVYPPAAVAVVTPLTRSSTSGSKPALETRTLYYHEALLKAQQEQQQDQANQPYPQAAQPKNHVSEQHIPITIPTGNGADSLPERSFSQNSHYSHHHHQHHNHQPRRSTSQGSQRPPISSKRPGRNTPSVDYRAGPREYPSIAQESLNWSHSRNASTASHLPYQPTRPRDGRESAMAHPSRDQHQEHDAEDEEQEEADRNIIHIAYVRRMTQEGAVAAAGPYGSFYEGVGQDDAAYAPTMATANTPLRPYSPRHV